VSKQTAVVEISNTVATAPETMGTLSRLMVQGMKHGLDPATLDVTSIQAELEYVAGLDAPGRLEFLRLANTHHVVVRSLCMLERATATIGSENLHDWCVQSISEENTRTQRAVAALHSICSALEGHGCNVTVIKSLDHWPDLGSDLDLYTSAHEDEVAAILRSEFRARAVERSWGDRLAHKWNFSVPGLPEPVEVHVRYLGQTGEQKRMAQRVIDRRVPKTVNGYSFLVPAPEERVLISTLQRMYRHFYFRLCDIVDFSLLLEANAIDFKELHKAADEAGIWTGVATFLVLISQYVGEFGGTIELPLEVTEAACSEDIRLYFENGFLRVPRIPAAGLYGRQVLTAGRNGDLRAILRLPLLPPLAISAVVALRLTGSDKGVW
jgi:hypothetical protein